ncbi:MAG: hypothetical protein KDC57_05245 [Saprospiraceae bacterium]|nr:hypothetical protein [Saprospiraceae bacterium]
MRHLFISGAFILISILLTHCSQKAEESIPDVSDETVAFQLFRADQELLKDEVTESLKTWKDDHPVFTEIYLKRILGFDEVSDEEIPALLEEMAQDSGIQHIIHLVDSVYGDFGSLEAGFRQAFQFAKFYFPEKETPDLYTFISEYTIANFLFADNHGKDALGIGLDFYLFPEVDYKALDPSNPIFSDYLSRTFTKAHLVRKSMESWIDDWVGSVPAQGQLLDYMIHNGKKLYILHKLLPYEQDSILHEYTGEQMSWCNKNELEIWSYFIDQKLLYSNDLRQFNKYVFPSPTSAGMPEIAPGRTGNFIGYRVVQAYMHHHPEMSLQQLITETDSRKILNESKYKPERQ